MRSTIESIWERFVEEPLFHAIRVGWLITVIIIGFELAEYILK